MPIIRKATLKDALIISTLAEYTFRQTFRQDFIYAHELDTYCDETFNYSKIKKAIIKKENQFFVAVVDEEIVAYAKMKKDKPKVVELQKIYLHHAFHRQGLGLLLMNASIAEAKVLGYDTMWLKVVENNVKAITFYKQLGFDFIKLHHHPIGSNPFVFHQMDLSLKNIDVSNHKS